MEQLTFVSLFSGIEGFGVGLERVGMRCVFQVEKDRDCLRVLRRHWPEVPKFTDVGGFNAASVDVRPDWICGGFPCQDLSVAGRRAGLAGERSGLFFEFMRIVGEFTPGGVLIENVPGLISSWSGDTPSSLGIDPGPGRELELDETSDFSTVLAALSELGYGWAMRSFDAQYFGLPQRRERVFIVGCLGDMRRAAEILFERESLPWDSAPSRQAGARTAACLTPGVATGEANHVIAHTLRSEGADASEDGTGRGTPLAVVPIDMRQASRGATMTNNRREGTSGGPPGTGIGEDGDPSPTVSQSHPPAVAYQCQGTNVGPMGTLRKGNGNETGGVPFVFDERNVTSKENRSNPQPGDQCHTLHSDPPRLIQSMSVRRLTPRECSRLQGFPDNWLESDYADATKTHARQVLCEVWKATHTEAREGWRPRIAASLLTPEILLAGVYGGWISWSVARRCAEARREIPGQNTWTEGLVRLLWEAESYGSSPYRRESFEQFARELGRPVQVVPHEETQAIDDLLSSELWPQASAKWPLRHAFAASEAWSPTVISDSARYRMIGNAVAVPVAHYIAARILAARQT